MYITKYSLPIVAFPVPNKELLDGEPDVWVQREKFVSS